MRERFVSYIKKEHKTTTTKKKTKRKGKGKKKEETKKQKQVLPKIKLGTVCTPGRLVTTTPCETRSEDVDNILL